MTPLYLTQAAQKVIPLLIALMLCPTFVAAQSATSGAGFDTDQPIEILADSLEVQQDQQVATFAGNVQVIQGEIRLKAARLQVHYASDEGTSKTADGEDAPKIKRIDAAGDVFLSSPRETAKGDRGTYDVLNKQINLQGNVVLTQGQNVLRGERMVLDLVSGRSRIDGNGTGNTSGRVRGIFVPQKKE